jgi:hypothetical protein
MTNPPPETPSGTPIDPARKEELIQEFERMCNEEAIDPDEAAEKLAIKYALSDDDLNEILIAAEVETDDDSAA